MTDEEADRRFLELTRQTSDNRIGPQLLVLHAAGKHEEAQKLLDATRTLERLRAAPREVAP